MFPMYLCHISCLFCRSNFATPLWCLDVTVLLLDDTTGRKKTSAPTVGLLSSMARTFVQDGVTTEYATHVIGTTVGDRYAHIVSTGSRVFYDNVKPTNRHDTPEIDLQTILDNLGQQQTSSGESVKGREEEMRVGEEDAETNFIKGKRLVDVGAATSPPPPPAVLSVDKANVSVRQEISVRKGGFGNPVDSIKPAKVNARNGLPTFTVNGDDEDRLPPTWSPPAEHTTRREDSFLNKLRSSKNLFRNGLKPIEIKKYETVTYFGFADFVTTVGNTVIIFMPKTPTVPEATGVTSIKGEATLRPEDRIDPTKSSGTLMFTKTTAAPSAVGSGTAAATNAEKVEYNNVIESSMMTTTDETAALPTEPLSRRISETTRVFNNEQEALGLLKTIGGVDVIDSKTTRLTTFFYGTYLNGKYTQLEQTVSTLLSKPSQTTVKPSRIDVPVMTRTPQTTVERQATTENTVSEVTTEPEEPAISTTPEEELISTTPEEEPEVSPTLSSSSENSVLYKTYTYLTTFFIPVDESLTTTSVKSRIVLSPESARVTETTAITRITTSTTESVPMTSPDEESVKYTTADEEMTITTESEDKDVSESTTTVPMTEEVQVTTEKPVKKDSEMTTEKPVANDPDDTELMTTEKPVVNDRDADDKEITTDRPVNDESDDKVARLTTVKPVNKDVDDKEEVMTEISPTSIKPVDDEEVELLFKTFYTTYTYLTTFFQETTTSVSSREEVVTNVVVSTVEKDFLATDPAVAGLFDREEGNLLNTAEARSASARDPRVLATRVGSGRPSSAFLRKPADDILFASTLDSIDYKKELATPPLDDNAVKTFSKTYTYFTTLVSNGSTNLKSHTEVYTNVIMPSNMPLSSQRIQPTTVRNTIKPTLLKVSEIMSEPMDEPETVHKEMEKGEGEDIETKKHENNETIMTPSYKYDMTITRNRTNYSNMDEDKSSSNSMNDVIGESMITGTKSISSNNIKRKVSTDEDEDMESSETNEDVEPSPSPGLELQTSFTTYTYFTTIYKGSSSSQVVSRFETVTNVVPQTIESTEVDNSNIEESTLPVTFFTTYTYWTTLYKDSNTIVTSRKETLTNVVSPSVSDSSPSIVATIKPSSTQEVMATEKPHEPEFTTFFTTFTYFTTSYLDNETVVNSRLETATNVLNMKDTEEYMNNESTGSRDDSVIKTAPENAVTEKLPSPVLKPTGLISSITTKEVNGGETTSFTTDVYGTYIDGLYAQVLESRSNVVKNVSPSEEVKPNSKSTGIVALNEGKIVDADGVSTTFYTTKAIGTYIDQLYAQVIESTSSLKVNDNKTVSDPSTTVLGSKTYRTGLISLIEGTSVKDASTTYYETKVIGKVVDGKYTQEYESDSSIKIGVQPTAVQEIKASSTQLNEILQSEMPISPSPATIESSQGENGSTTEKNDDADEENVSKKKTFPVIRPFASRPRPTFQPKKKTADSLNAATINRSITPTIVATPALKTNDKGVGPSSRNRFSGGNRKSSSSQIPAEIIIPSSSSLRKYSRSKSSNAPIVSPSINFRSRTPSSTLKITPTSSLSSFGASRRSSFSQRPSGSKLPDTTARSSSPTSRFRIRPTVSSNFNRFQSSTVTASAEDVPDNNEVSTAIVTEETLLTSNSEDEEGITAPSSSTTTESSRRGNNPLLKLRRPPLPRTPITTQSPRRNPARTTARTTTSTTTTTPRPQRPKTPSPLITRNRPKPVNGLFPSRGFGKKEQELEVTSEANNFDEEKSQQQEANADEVSDDGGSGGLDGAAVTQVEPQSNAVSETERPSRGSRTFNNQVQIRPFNNRRTRTKRQAEFGNRNDNSRSYRSRQLPAKNAAVDYYYYDEYVEQDTPAPVRTLPPPRRQPTNRSRQPQKVTPTTSSSNSNRSQFTLREKTPTTAAAAPAPTSRTSNFRRTRPPVQLQEATTSSKRLSRLRYPTTTTTTPEPVRNNRRYMPSARRQSSRTRFRDDLNTFSNTQSVFDGSITVTHRIPTELTIPIVIGKNTEYKQVLTAKPSIEILGPHQYSTVAGKNGFPTIQLAREVTETLPNGVMEITKFVIHEQPTSSITFTPTYIRGRKTSYSHVIPSTIYEVKPEVNTIQPQLANAPLANLLLSQLLLGNLGIQQTINPLLALNSAMVTAQTPITEYKTKSTTYVTTVTDSTSTVLPITFRGKVISTTVVDSSTNVITATEYITETIVTTPTVQQTNNQLNTLLLPALLQAQLLGQATTANNLLGSIDSMQDELLQELIEPTPKYEDVSSRDESKPVKKKNVNKKPPDPAIQPAEASVVTLYVSGKRPGEFSTVLSTVNYDETATVRKREVEPSSVIDSMATAVLEDVLLSSADDDEQIQRYDDEETQSLESILGDVSKNVKIENRATKTKVEFAEPSAQQQTKETTGHFLLNGSADTPVQREVVNSKIWSPKNRTKRDASDFTPTRDVFLFDFPKIPKTYLTQKNVLHNGGDRENSSFTISKNLQDYKVDVEGKTSFRNIVSRVDFDLMCNIRISADEQRGFDERRFNFATKKMSNGVEVIVAGDKSTYPGQASVLRVLPTSQTRPITLAPSTLTDHMLMMLPHPVKQVCFSKQRLL